MKKLLAILLCLCILLSCVPTTVIAQGELEDIVVEQNVTAPTENTTALEEETATPAEVEPVEATEAPVLLAEGHDHYACACAITADTSCTHEGQINWQPWDGSKSITNTESEADIMDSNGDGVYEIYTAQGLRELENRKTEKFVLMNDIDMQGADWTPIIGFAGSFDGNGHTISNVSITKSTPNLINSGAAQNMGFFGDTTAAGVVRNLHLRDITITATQDALYVGLLAGSNRGQMSGCTASGTIIDSRQTHGTKTYMGAMIGRICNPSGGADCGSMTGGTSLAVTDSEGVATTNGLCADVVFAIASKDNLYTGLVAWHPPKSAVSGEWAGRYCNSNQLSQEVRARQDKVIDYMTAMAMVAWSPSEELIYIAQGDNMQSSTTQHYLPGQTYYGLPYNHNNGSLERFNSALQPGTNITKKGLGNSIWNEKEGYPGFVQLMGNNCSRAVGWAWMQVSPVLVASNGGAHIEYTGYMLPNDVNRSTYGVYPVGIWNSNNYGASRAAYQCTTEEFTSSVLAANGENTMLEAYAHATRADAMVYYQEDGNGHARLIAADPVVIRSTDGTIDAGRSYFVITEQGWGISTTDGDNTSWRVKHKYTFKELLSAENPNKTYIPVTMRALRDEAVADSYVQAVSVNTPADGQVSSNYRIVSTTLTVKKGEQVIYDGEIFTGVGGTYNKYSGTFETVKLNCHKDAYLAAATAAGLENGSNCTFSVKVLLSDGTVKIVAEDKEFTYNAEGHDHYACACAITADTSCTHEGQINWQPWDGSKSITNTESEPVYYYLTGHVKLAAGRGLYGNVVLCLNGYSISPASSKSDNKFLLQVGANGLPANVTIMDCGTQCAGGVCTYKEGSGLLNGNSSNGSGGAIQVGHVNTSSTLSLIGVHLSGNAESNGGENYGGGALHVRNGNVTIQYCKFDNNRATGANVGSGGAISVYMGSVNASSTVFSGNQAVSRGGAIFLRPGSNASLRLTNCQFSGQNTAVDGSAVYVGKGCSVTVTGTTFSNNTATGNGAVNVETSAGAVSISGGSFTGNNGAYGSALYIAGTNNVSVSGTSFTDNTAKNGAIYVGSANLNLNNVTVKNNAGGLYIRGGAAKVVLTGNTQIESNTVENVKLHTGTHLELGALGENAKISVATAADETELNFLTANADAGFDADAWTANTKWLLYENTGAYISYSAENNAFYLVPKITHTHHACECVITRDTSCSHAGDSLVWQEWSDPNSLPTANAGNYYLSTNVVLSSKQTITANINLCLNGHTITPGEGMNDGLIRLDDSKNAVSVTIMDCATSYDSATGVCSYVGGIKGGHSTTGSGAVQVGHHKNEQASVLTLIGVELSGNTESNANENYGGGALHLRNGSADIRYCKFADNKADGKKETVNEQTQKPEITDVGAGGAISIYQGAVSAKNTVFAGNEAVRLGGAIYLRNVECGLELTGCEFIGNTAVYGSAVYTQANNTVNIAETSFTGNTASKNGTIYVVRGTTTLTDVIITQNKGGLCIGNVENTVVTVCGNMQIHDNGEDVYLSKDGTKLYVGQLDENTKVNITTKTSDIADPDDFLAVAENVTLADTEATGLIYAAKKNIGYEAGDKKFYFPGEQVDEGDHNHCYCIEGTVAGCDHREKAWKAW